MKIVIDTETTGVTTSDEILQVSIIDEHANVLFNELIRPDFKESWPFAQAVHGISPENVANCNNFAYFRDRIQNIINEADEIIGYNVTFDLNFLERFGIECKSKPVYDVMYPFSKVYGEWNSRFKRYTWQKLTTCASYYGYQWEESAHNSLGDVKATLFCYNKLQQDLLKCGG